jgi:hypothetical protein
MIFIDLTQFDQSKLEYLLRKIPEALVKIEKQDNVETRFYRYDVTSNFSLSCEATHFNHKEIPSFEKCRISVNSDFSTQEVQLDFSDTVACGDLKKHLPYGKLRSTEIFYGESHTGRYKNIFSYSFDVTRNCLATFAVKK